VHPSNSTPVQVVARLRDGATEALPATPLGGGRYRLTRSASLAPLACGDVVTCADAGAGDPPHVTEVEPGEAVLTVFQAYDGTDVDALVALWQATGAGATEGRELLVTAWPAVPMDAVAQQLNGDEDAGKGAWILAAEPHERRTEAQSELDLR
jgi:hypothetical protein